MEKGPGLSARKLVRSVDICNTQIDEKISGDQLISVSSIKFNLLPTTIFVSLLIGQICSVINNRIRFDSTIRRHAHIKNDQNMLSMYRTSVPPYCSVK